MRRSISAQSCASVPPVPAWISRSRVPAVVLAVEEGVLLHARELALERDEALRDLVAEVLAEREQLARVLVLLVEPLVALELAGGARVLGRDARRLGLVVPEAGRAQRLLELAEARR